VRRHGAARPEGLKLDARRAKMGSVVLKEGAASPLPTS